MAEYKALFDEYREIWGRSAALDAAEERVKAQAATMDPTERSRCEHDAVDHYRAAVAERAKVGTPQAALCLSGGGIRSAAFALGVIQGLAREGLLTQFHYLSTVSGGGYIGGWLSRWIRDEMLGGRTPREAVRQVEAELSTSGAVEPPALKRLRELTNFLTPEVGAASVDTWTGVVLYIRNVLLNWGVFLPALMCAALLPNLVARGMDGLEGARGGAPLALSVLLLLVGLAAYAAGLYRACRYLPSHRIGGPPLQPPRGTALEPKGRAHVVIISCAMVWAFACALFLGSVSGTNWFGAAVVDLPSVLPGASWVADRCASFKCLTMPSKDAIAAAGVTLPPLLTPDGPDPRGPLAVWLGVLTWCASMAAYLAAWWRARGEDPGAFRSWNLLSWTLSSVFGALLLTGGCLVLWRVGPVWQFDALAALGPVWVAVACLAQASLHSGIRRQRPDGDDDREWIARVSAVCLQLTAAWGLLAAACLLLPRFLWDGQTTLAWSSSAVAAASTLFSAFGGSSAWSKAGKVMTLCGASLKIALSVAAAVGIAGLLALFSRLQVNVLIGWLGDADAQALWQDKLFGSLVLLAAFMAGLAALMSYRVGVNRFSMHGFYRNRLARAFLGSAHEGREPHPFTGFDSGDNPRMWELATEANTPPRDDDHPRRVLFPVVNVALNLTKSTRLAWQERKAMSFTITPLACGSADLQPRTPEHGLSLKELRDPMACRSGAYVSSKVYGGPEIPDDSWQYATPPGNGAPGNSFTASPPGISLATAMTLSGAAASPNMGYHSTKATAFLMTLFNVRLGAWLPNPAYAVRELWTKPEPRFGLVPMLDELAGQADERGPYVYLSDGGHFDNLGIYEMVRRRCRLILVSDAGCDPACGFEDLGNAVRKCMIDQNVGIEFQPVRIAARGKDDKADKDAVAFAVGTIRYPEGGKGMILYIKPTYLPDLPLDVQAYALANKDFPHQSTGDQWFSESQFESYRGLGLETMKQLFKGKPTGTLDQFFGAFAAPSSAPPPPNGGLAAKLKIVDVAGP
ncbi:patatin-like phospholipase family protein [Azospirillum sp. TSO22-1]|uniref:patatin-like phospholipase family protein n=1 Tax=Azospirillum sp. TSO22-1 TaxID=716789 RepID=UPI000D60EA9B|nr:patatin-like phospholipase family protein [Azospirillum sp. TSO22-1]PWC54602.1 hypothetical protein TSO221_08155 [Azospirillum sp. TSO22-1]